MLVMEKIQWIPDFVLEIGLVKNSPILKKIGPFNRTWPHWLLVEKYSNNHLLQTLFVSQISSN